MENTEGALLLSAEQCAKLLGLGRTYIFRLLAEGRLESIAVGRRRLIPRAALDAFIARELADQADATSVQSDLFPAASGEEKV